MEQRDEEDGSERRGAGGVRQGRRRGRGVAARGAPGRRARGSAEMGVCFRARAARSPGSVPLDLDRGGGQRDRERRGGGIVGGVGWIGARVSGGCGVMGNGGGRLGLCPVGPVGGGPGRLGRLAQWGAWPSLLYFFRLLFFCFIFCIFFLLFIFCSVLFFLYNSL